MIKLMYRYTCHLPTFDFEIELIALETVKIDDHSKTIACNKQYHHYTIVTLCSK